MPRKAAPAPASSAPSRIPITAAIVAPLSLVIAAYAAGIFDGGARRESPAHLRKALQLDPSRTALPLEGGGGASLRVSVAPLPAASALEPAPPARPTVREGAGYSLIHSAPLLLGVAVAAAAALTLPFFCVAACAKGERKRELI